MEDRKIVALHEAKTTDEVNRLLQNPKMEFGKIIGTNNPVFIVAEYDK